MAVLITEPALQSHTCLSGYHAELLERCSVSVLPTSARLPQFPYLPSLFVPHRFRISSLTFIAHEGQFVL